jgi:2-phosphosulfolactate phosphatase
MRFDVYFGPAELSPGELNGRVVAVIDVLRASTTIAAALFNGARSVIPFESSDEVIARSKSFERSEVLLAGERKMLPIPGFDLGNSPLEFTREAIGGKTVLMTTTNGTVALAAVTGARDTVVASYANYTAVLALLRAAARGGTDVSVLCSGTDRHFSLEDAACAGRFVAAVARDYPDATHNDAARTATLLHERYGDRIADVFADTMHGRLLAGAGFHGDLAACATLDGYPVVPIYHERQITKLGPERER